MKNIRIFHIVYKVINIINNNIYIGVHSTNNINDNYLGSGSAIRKAIKKYGKENFIKEILFIFNTREDALAKEKELVSKKFINEDETYNLQTGGNGGNHNMVTVYNPNQPDYYFNVFKDDSRYINNELLFNAVGRKHKESTKEKIGKKHKNKKFSKETRELISKKNSNKAILKNIYTGQIKKVSMNDKEYFSKDWVGIQKGETLSNEAKLKISEASKRPCTDERKKKLSKSKKGKVIVKYYNKQNEKGFLVNKDDIRIKNGELIPVNTLRALKDINSNESLKEK